VAHVSWNNNISKWFLCFTFCVYVILLSCLLFLLFSTFRFITQFMYVYVLTCINNDLVISLLLDLGQCDFLYFMYVYVLTCINNDLVISLLLDLGQCDFLYFQLRSVVNTSSLAHWDHNPLWTVFDYTDLSTIIYLLTCSYLELCGLLLANDIVARKAWWSYVYGNVWRASRTKSKSVLCSR